MLPLVTTHRRDPRQILTADAGTTLLIPLGNGRVRLLQPNEVMTKGEARTIRNSTYHAVVETGPTGAVAIPLRIDLAIESTEDGEATATVEFSSRLADIGTMVRSWRPNEDAEAPVRAAVATHVKRVAGRFSRGSIYQAEERIIQSGFTLRGLTISIDSCTIDLTSESKERVYEVERIQREQALATARAEFEQRREVHERNHAHLKTRIDDMARVERQNHIQRSLPGWSELPLLTQLRLLATDMSAESIATVMQEIREDEQIARQQQLQLLQAMDAMDVLSQPNLDGIASQFGVGPALPPPPPRALGAPLAKEPPAGTAAPSAPPAPDDDDVIDVEPGVPTNGTAPPRPDSIDDEVEEGFQRLDGRAPTAGSGGDEHEGDVLPKVADL